MRSSPPNHAHRHCRRRLRRSHATLNRRLVTWHRRNKPTNAAHVIVQPLALLSLLLLSLLSPFRFAKSWSLSSCLASSSAAQFSPLIYFLLMGAHASDVNVPKDGPSHLSEGRRLFQLGRYAEAAPHFWRAVLFHAESPRGAYSVEDAFGPFVRCYALRGKTADGLVFVAAESYGRGQADMARTYVESALGVEPGHDGALTLKRLMDEGRAGVDLAELVRRYGGGEEEEEEEEEGGRGSGGSGAAARASGTGTGGRTGGSYGGYAEGSPEYHYNVGTEHFNAKRHADAASAFDESCARSGGRLGVACTNAVYCRTNILDWGPGGRTFDEDMKTVERITSEEALMFRSVDEKTGTIRWKRTTSAHPHMMLGYPLSDSMLKRYVAESYAELDETHARIDESGRALKPLPEGLPYDRDADREKYVAEASEAGFRLKIGFVASGFNSKAVLYLSQDMFRFFDPDTFEVHVFSTGKADNPDFIKYAMRGVDWRERVRVNVDSFHDVRRYKDDHIGLARYVRARGVHVLIEWDGYARQGERAQGLFALRPAPVQILHQEFLGTSGAQYVDFIVTDRITSPPELEHLYVEQFIYMPNHFFSKGHAMQKEVKVPTYEYEPARTPYVLGTGRPSENRCLAPEGIGPKEPSFVFCNFNKFLKNNPETMRSWLKILRDVPNSMLCLLENPKEGVPHLRRFVSDACESNPGLCGGNGDDMNARIHLLPWQANPFDHQMRNQDFCDVMLDSYPYNGHTVAQDSLYGGVPIVTRSDGPDMSSRVTTSANVVLGLDALNAWGEVEEYERIAVALGTNLTFYDECRTKLIDSCLKKDPMHPYWDVPRYVRNFQAGLKEAWERYLAGDLSPPSPSDETPASRGDEGGGRKKRHIVVVEEEETKRGTYESDIPMLERRRKEALKKRFLDSLTSPERKEEL